MSYDVEARRATPLQHKLARRIAEHGPMPVRDYVAACLHDDECGYYRTRPAIGRHGDFITAPEISQVFGELIGAWCATVWLGMGGPSALDLVELGPGRGTLMADALRATRRVPGLHAALRLRLVETNGPLRDAQADALAGTGVAPQWSDGYPPLERPTIVIANEFLDTSPVRQHVRTAQGWQERVVELDSEGRLQFAVGRSAPDDRLGMRWPDAPLGAVVEQQEWSLPDWLGRASAKGGAGTPTAALLIDYGYGASRLGDTLQAVRSHAYEHPLTSPGEADLTTHVDFARLGEGCARLGLAVDGPLTQAEFLGRLGVVERASRLMAANPAKAGAIEAGVARLIAPQGMGSRFLVLGVRSAGMGPLPGFSSPDRSADGTRS